MHFHSCPLLYFCCAPDAAPLARCLTSSRTPLSSPRAFAPRLSAPPGVSQAPPLTWTPEAEESSAGPSVRQSGLHLRLPQALRLRAPRRRSTRSALSRRLDPGGSGCRTGCGRGRGGGGAGIWVAWSGASRDAAGEACEEEATASSRGRACRGFPGSTTRAATEHAQSPGRAGGAGAVLPKGALCGSQGERVKPADPAAVDRMPGVGCSGPV